MPRNLSNVAKREIALLKEMDARAEGLELRPDPAKDIPLSDLAKQLRENWRAYWEAKTALELHLVVCEKEREKMAERVLGELS